MPTSCQDSRDILVRHIARKHSAIDRLLDVAAGYGEVTAQLKKSVPVAYAAGCELWWPYMRDPRHRAMYDCVIMGDIRHTLTLLPDAGFDVVICVAVLEHLEREAAHAVADQVVRVARLGAYMVTPIGPYAQGIIEGNPHEVHRTTWRRSDWTDRGWAAIGSGARSTVFEADARYRPGATP